jgi:DNA-binding transcriptional ArsR family regulator
LQAIYVKKGVELVTSLAKAKVLVDPMRREVVRLLAERPMTEKELARALGLSDPTVGFHLKILRRSGLIQIFKKEVEEHGIVQKFYEASALVYLISDSGMPLEIERYFMPLNLERARGVIAALNVKASKPRDISNEELAKFAKVLTSTIVQTASKHQEHRDVDGEKLLAIIYRDALDYLKQKRELLPRNVGILLTQ